MRVLNSSRVVLVLLALSGLVCGQQPAPAPTPAPPSVRAQPPTGVPPATVTPPAPVTPERAHPNVMPTPPRPTIPAVNPALPPQRRIPPAPAMPAQPAAPVDARVPTIERERTVYVPFEDLEKVFKDGGKGVFLPYREFLDLWNELTLKREKDDKPPPADAVLARAEYTGRVEGESLILDAKITVESFKKGWVLLPLVGNAPAIGEAETGKAVLRMKDGGADVLLPEKGSYELALKIYAPIKRADGKNRVTLNLPRAAVSRLSIAVPGEGLEFTMNPAAAYTTQVAAGQTQFSCFFGSGGAQEIAWGAAQAVTQMQPLVLASTKMTTRIGVASVSTQADIAYRILRSPVAELQIKLPATQEVLGVTGAGIKEWKINMPAVAGNLEQAQKTLVISLEKPVRDDLSPMPLSNNDCTT